MNNKLLFDVITRQAGSIEKAWLEIVQNAIDAKATEVLFRITTERFTASDNGKGMDKQEIVTYFEEFGNSSKQDSDLGEFGMGRGQIFAQGKTNWNTQNYRMIVDVKNKGLEYELIEEKENKQGTSITCHTYNRIRFLEKKIERFAEWIKYVEINVWVNGVQFNKKLTMPIRRDYGLIELTDGDRIEVYNRGIFVKDDVLGSGAILVSTKNLKVNFARNDIMDDCPIYNTLLQETKEMIADKLKGKQNLSSDDRKTILNLIKENKKWGVVFADKKVILTANNNFISLNDVEQSDSVYFSDGKNQYEDDLLIESGYTILKNIPSIRGIMNDIFGIMNVGNYQELVQNFRYVIQKEVNEQDLVEQEQHYWDITKKLNLNLKGVVVRKLRITKNMVANANTDGKNFITINYNNIKNFDYGYVLWLLLHEYSHENNTENTDEHGYEFYEKFYGLSQKNTHLIGGH